MVAKWASARKPSTASPGRAGSITARHRHRAAWAAHSPPWYRPAPLPWYRPAKRHRGDLRSPGSQRQLLPPRESSWSATARRWRHHAARGSRVTPPTQGGTRTPLCAAPTFR
jgi:hypothetical protein